MSSGPVCSSARAWSSARPGRAAFLSYALSRLLDHHGDADARRDGGGEPLDRLVRRLRARALGGWAGFSVGWLYWYFWVIVIGFEAVAGGKVIQYWVTGIPLWLLSLVLMSLMTATNLFSVSSFGEFEFWFAGIKVAAILLFLVHGCLFVARCLAGQGLRLQQPDPHGGFFPAGPGAVFAAIVVVIFSMVGAEVATIAAAESPDPGRSIAKATNSVIGADRGVLRGVGLPAGGDPAVELRRPWPPRRTSPPSRPWAFPAPTRHHERRGADGGPVLPQLRPVHVVADAVRACRSARGAGRA